MRNCSVPHLFALKTILLPNIEHLTQILGLISVSLGHHLAAGTTSGHRIFISFMSTVSIIYPLTALVVFSIHCYVSSLLFESVQSEIHRNEIQLMNGRDQDVRLLILAFKQRHILACKTVDSINHCFGWILLLSITFFYLAVINSSFYLFGLDNIISMPDVAFTTFTVIHLICVCFTADRVQIKVEMHLNFYGEFTVDSFISFLKAEDAIKELFRLQSYETLNGSQMQLVCIIILISYYNKISNYLSNFQMNFLISEMALTVPKISAHGCFNVSKKLLPQVVVSN
jgi:hypothetical protein